MGVKSSFLSYKHSKQKLRVSQLAVWLSSYKYCSCATLSSGIPWNIPIITWNFRYTHSQKKIQWPDGKAGCDSVELHWWVCSAEYWDIYNAFSCYTCIFTTVHSSALTKWEFEKKTHLSFDLIFFHPLIFSKINTGRRRVQHSTLPIMPYVSIDVNPCIRGDGVQIERLNHVKCFSQY